MYDTIIEYLGAWELVSSAVAGAADDLAASAEQSGVTAEQVESEEYCTDIRLCVWPAEGRWCVNTGDVQYDTEHAPICIADCIAWTGEGEDAGWEHGYEVAERMLAELESELACWEAEQD